MLLSKNTEFLFDNLKDGDMLGFHFESFWKYPIGRLIHFFSFKINPSAKKDNLIAIEHVGMVYGLIRKKNIVSFYFGEMTGVDNRQKTLYTINKVYDIYSQRHYFTIDSYFTRKFTTLYYLQHKYELTNKQKEICCNFWDNSREYNIANAIASINYIQKFLNLFGWSKSIKNTDNFCSSAVHNCNYEMGFCINNDTMPTPTELTRFDYINEVFKIFKK
jgi:hypothetical protein